MKSFSVVVAAITTLAGCASAALQGYEGADRPNDETALIEVERPQRMRGVQRVEIVSLSLRHGIMEVEATRVRVLPEETCLAAHALSDSGDSAQAYLCFEPEVGETYVLSVGTTIAYVDSEGSRDVRSDYFFRIRNRSTHENAAIAARGAADCEVSTFEPSRSYLGGRGRDVLTVQCQDSG